MKGGARQSKRIRGASQAMEGGKLSLWVFQNDRFGSSKRRRHSPEESRLEMEETKEEDGEEKRREEKRKGFFVLGIFQVKDK